MKVTTVYEVVCDGCHMMQTYRRQEDVPKEFPLHSSRYASRLVGNVTEAQCLDFRQTYLKEEEDKRARKQELKEKLFSAVVADKKFKALCALFPTYENVHGDVIDDIMYREKLGNYDSVYCGDHDHSEFVERCIKEATKG